MSWHLISPSTELYVTSLEDRETRWPVVAIPWDDQHEPNDNDLREFRYLVLREPGARRPSWILGPEISGVYSSPT